MWITPLSQAQSLRRYLKDPLPPSELPSKYPSEIPSSDRQALNKTLNLSLPTMWLVLRLSLSSLPILPDANHPYHVLSVHWQRGFTPLSNHLVQLVIIVTWDHLLVSLSMCEFRPCAEKMYHQIPKWVGVSLAPSVCSMSATVKTVTSGTAL